MTIEERVEFLMQSIESHDRQIGAKNVDALGHQISKLTEMVQLNFDRLNTVTLELSVRE